MGSMDTPTFFAPAPAPHPARRGGRRAFVAVLGAATLLLSASSLGAGCLYPIRQDDACAKRISECLGDCREDPGHGRATGTEFHVGTDTRTACERRCDSLCR